MAYIKINVRLLGRYPGMIIDESDPHFEAFKGWADNKDRHGGREICEMCDAPEEEKVKVQEPAPPQGKDHVQVKPADAPLEADEGDKKKGKGKK